MAALDVDDAQPANPEGDAVGEIEAAIVRPAMCHDVRHPDEPFLGDQRPPRAFDWTTPQMPHIPRRRLVAAQTVLDSPEGRTRSS